MTESGKVCILKPVVNGSAGRETGMKQNVSAAMLEMTNILAEISIKLTML